MNLGALLKWGLFNKWEWFRKGGPGSLYSETFHQQIREAERFHENLMKSPKMYVLKSSKTISLMYKTVPGYKHFQWQHYWIIELNINLHHYS